MLDDNQIFLLSSYLRVCKSYLELSSQSSGEERYKMTVTLSHCFNALGRSR